MTHDARGGGYTAETCKLYKCRTQQTSPIRQSSHRDSVARPSPTLHATASSAKFACSQMDSRHDAAMLSAVAWASTERALAMAQTMEAERLVAESDAALAAAERADETLGAADKALRDARARATATLARAPAAKPSMLWQNISARANTDALAELLAVEARASNEKGTVGRARILFAASNALRPSLTTAVSSANMAFKLGRAAEAAKEFEAILKENFGEATMSAALEASVRKKLAEAQGLAARDKALSFVGIRRNSSTISVIAMAAEVGKENGKDGGKENVIGEGKSAASPPEGIQDTKRVVKQLMEAGHAANADGQTSEAQALFHAAFELGGSLQSRVSAANMALKLGRHEEAKGEYEGACDCVSIPRALSSSSFPLSLTREIEDLSSHLRSGAQGGERTVRPEDGGVRKTQGEKESGGNSNTAGCSHEPTAESRVPLLLPTVYNTSPGSSLKRLAQRRLRRRRRGGWPLMRRVRQRLLRQVRQHAAWWRRQSRRRSSQRRRRQGRGRWPLKRLLRCARRLQKRRMLRR